MPDRALLGSLGEQPPEAAVRLKRKTRVFAFGTIPRARDGRRSASLRRFSLGRGAGAKPFAGGFSALGSAKVALAGCVGRRPQASSTRGRKFNECHYLRIADSAGPLAAA